MRKGSGTALSDKIKYLGVFLREARGRYTGRRQKQVLRVESGTRCSRLTEEGAPAADPTNLEPRLDEIFQRNLAAARRLVNLAMAAKE